MLNSDGGNSYVQPEKIVASDNPESQFMKATVRELETENSRKELSRKSTFTKRF
jgi:hypothetical protein